MKKTRLNFNGMRFPDDVLVDTKLPYLRPEIAVQHVELENDCLATGSVAGGASPQVNDWGADSDPGNIGNSGDLSL